MKFIHTTDINLDSRLSGLAAYKNVSADLLRIDRHPHRMVDTAIEESVSFMAGKDLPHRETHAQA